MKDILRIAAVADLHVKKTGQASLQPLFAAASAEADVLLLCGDLTDYGLVDEAKFLAKKAEIDSEKEEEKALSEEKDNKLVFPRDYYDSETINVTLDYLKLLNKEKVAKVK